MVMAPGGNLGGGPGSLQPANLPWYPPFGIVGPLAVQNGTINSGPGQPLTFQMNGVSVWQMNPNLVPGFDNQYDLGTPGARIRNAYLGGNLVAGGTIQSGNIGIGGTPVAGTALLVASGNTGGITIADATKVAGYGATGMTLSGYRVTGANGSAIPGPPLKGAAADGPVTGFSAWWWVVMNGFAGGWVPIYN